MKTSLTALATIALSAALWLGGPAQADTPPAKGQVPVAATTVPAPAPVAAPVAANPEVAGIIDARMADEPWNSILAAITRHFPDEAAAMRAAMIDTASRSVATGTPLPNGIDQGRAVLARLAPLLAGARDADLITILDDQIALYAALRASPRDCARVFVDGIAPTDFSAPLLADYDFAARTDRLYGAMAAARGLPARAPAEQGHYVALVNMLAGDAAGQAALAAIERLDPADPLLCDAGIRFFEALRDARFPGADRLRAAMLVELMAG